VPTLTRMRPRLLLVSMYPLDQGRWGPTVRISHLRDELSRRVALDVVDGYRGRRRMALARYALSGRLRGLDGIYVENSSTLPSETDLLFLALARALRIPVLTYVRDAQYLFDEYYPATSVKRRVARSLFLPAIRAMRAVSSRVAYPSVGLARAVRAPDDAPTLLPPGSPEPMSVERRPDARTLLFVGAMRYAVHGLDLLLASVERARADGVEVDVVCVSRRGDEPPAPRPPWLTVVHGGQAEIRSILPRVLATIQPRHRSPYNDLAVPIKVMEYLAYGRPLLVTDCLEQARIVRDAGAGIVVDDAIEPMAEGIRRIATAEPDELDGWSANALAAARRTSWGVRAERIVELIAELAP